MKQFRSFLVTKFWKNYLFDPERQRILGVGSMSLYQKTILLALKEYSEQMK